MSGQNINEDILGELSRRLLTSVSNESRDRARLHLLDWMGCAVAGRNSETGDVFARSYANSDVNTAFYWGALGNILEMDDVDKRALLHPGPSIIPAALVSSHMVDADIDLLLDAIVRGYEATIRLGRAVGAAHYSNWHNTGTCGAIGAAAACASLNGLESERFAHAMGYAISLSAGLWQTRHSSQSMGKQLHTAHAARLGGEAVQIAKNGFMAPFEILEGEQGFFAAMCSDGRPNAVLDDYGEKWLIADVSFKPWPACRHAHAAIDAALEFFTKKEIPALRGPILLRTYSDALKFCDRPEPNSTIEAKFSLQHSVAVALHKGGPQLADFEEEQRENDDIAALRGRVEVCSVQRFDDSYPAHFGAELQIGDQVVLVPDALGDPENPMGQGQIQDKAATLLEVGGINKNEAAELVMLIQKLEGRSPAATVMQAVERVLS